MLEKMMQCITVERKNQMPQKFNFSGTFSEEATEKYAMLKWSHKGRQRLGIQETEDSTEESGKIYLNKLVKKKS